MLGLAGGNTKKHGNKKSGESRTPIRYNVIHMYIFAKYFISLAVFHAIYIHGIYNISIISECSVMISPNTGHIYSSSMYDGDIEAGRWMDLAIDNLTVN